MPGPMNQAATRIRPAGCRKRHARVGAVVVASVITFTLVACSHTSAPTVTSRDRAACTQLGDAYAKFNAGSGEPSPTAAYENAIAVAKLADNRQLRTAIVSWVTTMLHPTAGTASTGAPYATETCRQIGLPLQFRSPSPPTSVLSPVPAQTPTTDSEGGDND